MSGIRKIKDRNKNDPIGYCPLERPLLDILSLGIEVSSFHSKSYFDLN